MPPSQRKRWSLLPGSIAARGVFIVLFAGVSTALPGLFAWRLVAEEGRRERALREDAALAVALGAFLRDAPDTASREEFADVGKFLSEKAGRVRWAGLFDAAGAGVEFRRDTSIPLDEILGQVDLAQRAAREQPLRVGGVLAQGFVLTTTPLGPRCTIAAIIDQRSAARDLTGPLVGLAALAVAGLAVCIGWFRFGVQRPITQVVDSLANVQAGLSDAALSSGAPQELREALAAVDETCRELRKWRGEANSLRNAVDARVDAKTREVEKALRLAEREAETDALTQLRNRRALRRILPELFQQQLRAAHELSLVLIDIDHFKKLNDALGHAKGDELLHFFGELVRATLRRASDVAVRYGGDEFVLLLPDTSPVEAEGMIRRLVSLFGQRVRTIGAPDPQPTISAGIAGLQQNGVDSPEELLRLADEAMYWAKRKRRGVATVQEARANAGA